MYTGVGTDIDRLWRGYGAFGLAVPVPLPGQPNNVADMKPVGHSYCGSKFGFQQMLADLGFYSGAIDGKIGPGTLGAAEDFATTHGAPWGGPLSNEFCVKLIEVWTASQAQPAADPVTQTPTTTSRQMVTLSKVPRSILRLRPSTVATQQAQTATQPNGNGNGNGGGLLDRIKAWWGSQSTVTKGAVGVGAAGIVGLVIYSFVKKGGAPATATPNPRKRNKEKFIAAQRAKGRSRKQAEAAWRLVRRVEDRAAADLWVRAGEAAPSRQYRKYRKKRYRTNREMSKRARVKTGKIITLKSGKRYGHGKPPKRYYNMGARRQSDYAAPAQYGYPLVFRTASGEIKPQVTRRHIVAAKGKFTKFKSRYPMKLRRQIARNINKASKSYGVGGKVVKP
jgi:hypothetical protein